MTKTQTDGGPVRPPMPLYVGTQNDGLFLLDKPPSPAPYDGPIPAHYGPAVVIGNWPHGSDKAIEAVARYSQRVDAFVRALEAERDRLEAMRMPVELHDNNPTAAKWELWDSWVLHPAGLRAARAALNGGGDGE